MSEADVMGSAGEAEVRRGCEMMGRVAAATLASRSRGNILAWTRRSGTDTGRENESGSGSDQADDRERNR